MRWIVSALLIAGCDQGERTPPPAREPLATTSTYDVLSFIELEAATISDLNVPTRDWDWRRIKITSDGSLIDERAQLAKRRQLSPRRFVELVQELEGVGFLTLSPCATFDHGRHVTLKLNVPEGHNQIGDATTCAVLREPIRHIEELAD